VVVGADGVEGAVAGIVAPFPSGENADQPDVFEALI
jgi:hypothetical protein